VAAELDGEDVPHFRELLVLTQLLRIKLLVPFLRVHVTAMCRRRLITATLLPRAACASSLAFSSSLERTSATSMR